MIIEARAQFHFNEDWPVVIALGLGAIVAERVLRKYAQHPWSEKWRAATLSWGVAVVLVTLYIYMIKPALYH
jgi:hypothetical protein